MITVLVAGIALYGCGLFFAGLLLGRASTRSLAELLRLGGAEHHAVATVFKEHPKGGSWRDFVRWSGGE